MLTTAALGLPLVEEDLVRVEPLLAASVTIGESFIDSVTTHLIGAGGKRLRPLLSLAAATRGDRPATKSELLCAVSVELVHLSSLYHDDVIDEATVRRNVESVNSRFGNLVAIVAGDYLLARSAGIAADLGAEFASLLAHTLAALCQGQVAEVRYTYRCDREPQDYFAAIAGKTAELMATSCRMGALCAQAPASEVEAFTSFGRAFGMAFQLRDDVLDVVSENDELGKPPGQDLAEGIYTLPVIYALKDGVVGEQLEKLLGKPLTEFERNKARDLVASSGAIEATVAAAKGYIDEAISAIEVLGNPALTNGLSELSHQLLEGLPSAS